MKDKFIGFVDVLGFKSLVENVEGHAGITQDVIHQALDKLGQDDGKQFALYGPLVCPESSYLEHHLDFQVSPVSDCVLVSSEVSPAGAINLMDFCWRIVFRLLTAGFMCRGYITRDSIFHEGMRFFGSGYQKVLKQEKEVSVFKRASDEKGTPFVEVESVVHQYVRECGDKCVQNIFDRLVKTDGDLVALFPFNRFTTPFLTGVSPESERRSIEYIRADLHKTKELIMRFVDRSKPDAVRKSEHYLQALDEQLAICDQHEAILDELDTPFPPHSLSDISQGSPLS